MVKKKAKTKKVAKKRIAKKKIAKKTKKSKLKKKVRIKVKGEKVVAIVEHFFAKILVAAFKLKVPLVVGDVIHIKGHTTDFIQKVDSMQIEHDSISKAKKGQDVGIRVKAKVRQGDTVFLAANQSVNVSPVIPQPKPQLQPKPVTKAILPPKKTGYGETKFLKF